MTADWEPSQREGYLLSPPYINALYRTGRFAEGVEIARSLVARSRLRVGERHFFHGLARGYLATGLSRLGRDSEALQEFAAAMPILSSQQRQAGDGAGAQANRDRQTQEVVEAFIDLLTRVWTPVQKASFTGEAFRLADMVRGSAVQGAIAQSSARMAIDDPVLAALARNEQDLGKRVGAQYQLLNNVLALPSSDRDDKVEAGLRTAIVGLEVELDQVRERIARDFPGYAALVNPQPATIEQVQAALKPDEAFLSIYSGHDRTYVWAVPREGPAAFAVVPLSAAALEQKVARLRSALEPAVETIGDIPPFDTALSAELHDALLKPVEAGWKSARNLVVSTNGALAKLPFGVLVTGPLSAPAAAAALPFADYRQVPWLSRSHAVTSVPSAATFTILRRLPAGKASREKLIAFGDPLFNREQAAEAARPAPPVTMASATTMRGLPLLRRAAPQIADKNSVTLADLPRLADTADELKSIASTMGADPAQALHLGVEANEPKVAALPLANYRVVAFATHGLVPGELDGLTQPALALSASDVAGVGGDGLLTMEEILALKLDADWVVLSACNTGSGANAGAEAASGLGRAFFYAGTRAVLVTNWSVHSASARDLVSDVFRRQSTDPAVGRAEALRLAMLGLMDGPGYVDGSGKSLFSYGHPLFWAPYTVIGDGG
jgi:CHAT domain-containing protein